MKKKSLISRLPWKTIRILAAGSFLVFSLMKVSPACAGEAVLSWDTPLMNQDGTALTDLAGYKIYYGMASGTYSTTLDVGNTPNYTVPGLSEKVTYYFTVTAYNTSGNESGYSNEVFKTIPDATPPVISNITVNNMTSSGATIVWTTDEASTSQVEYGTTTAYGILSPNDVTLGTSHSVTLTSLLPWTVYHFRVRSADQTGNLAASGDLSFTTIAPPDTLPPTGAIAINGGAVYANGTVVSLALSCDEPGGQMQFSSDGISWNAWETFANTKNWTLSSGDGAKTVIVRFRDATGNVSSNYTAAITLDTQNPVISGVVTTAPTDTSGTVTWTTNEGSTTQVDYGANTAYGFSISLDGNSVTSHTVTLTGLLPSTTYHYQVKSRDGAGNEGVSTDYQFVTAPLPDTAPPAISGITVQNVTDSTATVTWSTDEAATTQIEYGTSTAYGVTMPENTALGTNHFVPMSGLGPNMVYHFRVVSRDGSGNAAVSSDYVFLTTQGVPPDQPAAISDLRLRIGASTRNSVWLDWTATGADGGQGTASGYDLRISKSSIVEDGVPLNSGEIHFADAVPVSNVPIPQSAGTVQSVQISGLETNTVYYMAIKAVDDKGNSSPLSNVINGGLVPPPPVTALRQGYTMISFPLVPATSDVQILLGPIVGAPVEIYWWSSSGLVNNQGRFVAEANVVPGYGYFLKTDLVNAVLDVSGSPVIDPSRSIPLQAGWNIIGNPYPKEVSLKDTSVRDVGTGEIKTFEDAVIAGWVGNAVYNFNGSTYDFSVYRETNLKLWHGYWLAVLKEGLYELIVQKP